MIDDIKPSGSFGGAGGPKEPAKIPPKQKPEPTFVPPEEVAERDEFVEEAIASTEHEPTIKTPKKRRRLRLPQLTRKQWLIGLAGFLVLAGGGVYYGLKVFRKPEPVKPVIVKEEPKPEPVKTTEPSKLTGLEVNPELNKLPITGIMIENSPDARPQAGLKDAGVVYEALVEGGITRFMAMFLDGQPGKIGPIRSARPPYLDFLVPWDAGYAHAGGSGQALAEINAQGIKDLDHGPNGGSFQRSAARYAPHNLYTGFQNMVDLQISKGFTSNNAKPFLRKKDEPNPNATARIVTANITAPLYNSHYDYLAETNSYRRIMAGQVHVDENGGEITPKVIIMPVMPQRYEGIYSYYSNVGSGKVYIFQDGNAIEGTWHKASRAEQISFKDGAGNPLAINAGQVWFTLLSTADQVSARPQ